MANLWRIFGKMNETAIINTIATAIGNVDQATNIYNAITTTLEKQAVLLNATKSKYANTITNKDQEILDDQRPIKYQKQKQSKLTKQVNLHFFEIERLRKSNVSWRGVAQYLKDSYKIRISHARLRTLFLELQNILEVKNAN